MISLARINLFDIVLDHLHTLRRLGRPGIYAGDVILFFVLPAVLAIPLALLIPDRLVEQAPKLLTATSLMGGLLFNLLARTAQIVEKAKKDAEPGSIRRVFAKEIHTNVAFGITLSLSCAIALVIFSFLKLPKEWVLNHEPSTIWIIAVAWSCFFLLILFVLTLLMIVKRMYVILTSDTEDM
jgi:hypothetical protein